LTDNQLDPSSAGAGTREKSRSAGPAPKAGFLRVVGAVLSAFVGIRKSHAAHRDVAIKPAHVVIAGVIAALVFIAILVTVVRLVVAR
jgi:hypothetical protein